MLAPLPEREVLEVVGGGNVQEGMLKLNAVVVRSAVLTRMLLATTRKNMIQQNRMGFRARYGLSIVGLQ